jgi:hypothetical protein
MQVQGGVGPTRMPDPIRLDLAISQVHRQLDLAVSQVQDSNQPLLGQSS